MQGCNGPGPAARRDQVEEGGLLFPPLEASGIEDASSRVELHRALAFWWPWMR